jgi:hypothetical protein
MSNVMALKECRKLAKRFVMNSAKNAFNIFAQT